MVSEDRQSKTHQKQPGQRLAIEVLSVPRCRRYYSHYLPLDLCSARASKVGKAVVNSTINVETTAPILTNIVRCLFHQFVLSLAYACAWLGKPQACRKTD